MGKADIFGYKANNTKDNGTTIYSLAKESIFFQMGATKKVLLSTEKRTDTAKKLARMVLSTRDN